MITLDGYSLKYFGLSCEKQTNPMTPNFENKTLSIPGRDGLYYFGSEIKGKAFEFSIGTIDKDKISLQVKLREFARFLVDDYGKPRTIKLAYDYESDKYYSVMLSSPIDPDRVMRTGKFSLKFTAYNPYAYSVALSDEITWGSEVITFESHYLLGHEGSDSLTNITSPALLNIFVDGLAVKPVIEITGSATSLVLNVNGYSISLGSFANASWVIDCADYTVKKDGVSAFNSVSLRDFILLPNNNQVSITGTGLNISIRIKTRDKYI